MISQRSRWDPKVDRGQWTLFLYQRSTKTSRDHHLTTKVNESPSEYHPLVLKSQDKVEVRSRPGDTDSESLEKNVDTRKPFL